MSMNQQLDVADDGQIDMVQDEQIEILQRKQQAVIKNGKEFDWVKYKTEKCNDKDCVLSERKKETIFPLLFNCERWHNLSDRRRLIIVKDKNKFNYSRLFIKDTDKEDTRYCTNFFEYLYHPQNFRSKECPSVVNSANGTESNGSNGTLNNNKEKQYPCIYGMYCPYYHSQTEKNDWVTDLKATKYMAAPKEKFTQSLLDDFNNIQSSNKQLEKLYEQMNSLKGVSKNLKSSSQDLATPLPKNESPISEKLSNLQGSAERTFNTAHVLLDINDDGGMDRIDATLDPINENEEKQMNLKGGDNASSGRSSNREKGKKTSYSPKSKTMINLEQKEQKKKVQQQSNMKDSTTSVSQKDNTDYSIKINDVQNGVESKFKQEAISNKKNKKVAEIQQQENKHSSSSLNIPESKSRQDLDITKQASRLTDLSSNDEYLKEFSDVSTQRQSSKTYLYKQDLGHESSTVEFKNYQKLSTCKIQKDMNAILKLQEYGSYICGFLNHKGGTMYIGVHDEGWVDGVSLNGKQKDWFNQNIDYVTSQIEPRLVVGEIRINYIEVLNKPCQMSKDSKNYVIELQIVKTNYSDIYFYENNAYIKKQSSLTKMTIQEIKQDLQVKIKKQLRAESNTIQKMVMKTKTSFINEIYT